ncbi:MAG: DUF456 domain-containing protein [Treponema sp.]|nr:DUF456 domain-containing protein [Treponema sp.]
MELSVLFSILGGVLLIVGFLGTFVPVLPGAPLAWAGLLVSFFSSYNEISILCLVITGIFAVAVSILDNIFPIYMTNKTGGSKAATTGSTVGLIIGFFAGPPGVILGPFLGALIGELINTNGDFKISLKAAWGAFLGFLLGTGLKMITVMVFIWIFIISF